MAKPRKAKPDALRLPTALYLADSYMRMADRAIKDLDDTRRSPEVSDESGPTYLAISSFAFAVEIHLKLAIFIATHKVAGGHDLEELWNVLPKDVETWISENFERNYASTGEDWSVLVDASPATPGTGPQSRVDIPGASARDLIVGHRRAFEVGRYGYELPGQQKLKLVAHNIHGLQLLCWLTRALAYHLAEAMLDFGAAVGSTTSDGKRTKTVRLPGGVVERFP